MSSSHIFMWWCLTRGACCPLLQLTARMHPRCGHAAICVCRALPWLQAQISGLVFRQSQQHRQGRHHPCDIIALFCSSFSGWAGLTLDFHWWIQLHFLTRLPEMAILSQCSAEEASQAIMNKEPKDHRHAAACSRILQKKHLSDTI